MKKLFVHIPKTGGQSVFSIIDDPWTRTFPFRHDPLFVLEINNQISDDVFKFCLVRNPYKRTFSYYKHFLNQNELSNITFEEFLYNLKKKTYFKNTPMLLYPQSFYVYDLNCDISLNIFKYEKINRLKKILKKQIPHLNKGNYTTSEYYHSYTPQNIDSVKRLFECDFDLFDYSMEFV